MWRIFRQVVDFIGKAFLHIINFMAYGYHGIAKAVKLMLAGSDSVGSTITVPATGNEAVGAWKP